MTGSDESEGNVHYLPPRAVGDDANTHSHEFAVAPTLLAGAAVEPAAALHVDAGMERAGAAAQELDPQQRQEPSGRGLDAEGGEVQWADGTPTEAPARRRGLSRLRREALASAEPVSSPEPPNCAGGENADGDRHPEDGPAVASTSTTAPEPGIAPPEPVPTVVPGSVWSRPSGDHWSSAAEAVQPTLRPPGEGHGRARFLAPLALLVVVGIAAVMVIGEFSGDSHPPRKAFVSGRKARASTSNVVTITVPRVATHNTRAMSATKPLHKAKGASSTLGRATATSAVTTAATTTTPAVSDAPTVTTPPAVTTTPAATVTPTSAPKVTPTDNTSKKSAGATDRGSSVSGALPDVKQTEQQP